MKYILLEWPESQKYTSYEGFEEHSSLADCDEFGPSAYFIEEDWAKMVDSGEIELEE